MTLRIATLFSGGEGVGVGARQAGLEHAWGIDNDDAVAQVARDNGFAVVTADATTASPRDYERPNVLHASPPCPNFSPAKTGGKESPEDVAMARAVARFVEVLCPDIFTLENVYRYRKSESWAIIADALNRCGYWYDLAHVNSADYGIMVLCPLHVLECTLENVPNAARLSNQDFRMIAPDIAASVAMMRPEDQAMHLAWDAVAHLVRATKQGIAVDAAWQGLARLQAARKDLKTQTGKVAALLMKGDTSESASETSIDESIASLLRKCLDAPLVKQKWSTILMETRKTTLLKICESILATAIIPQSTTQNEKNPLIGKSETPGRHCPLCKYKSVPQTRKRMWVRALLGRMVPPLPPPEPWVGWYEAIEDLLPTLPESRFADWQLRRLPERLMGTLIVGENPNARGDCRLAHEPMKTVAAQPAGGLPRAFLVDSAGYPAGDDVRVPVTRKPGEPANTVVANYGRRPMRAFLVDGGNAGRNPTVRRGDEPMFTITAQRETKHPKRVWLSSGRVVRMTPRALARFQSFPDSYRLPESRTLACRVIGNAVPPLQYRKIIAQLAGLYK